MNRRLFLPIFLLPVCAIAGAILISGRHPGKENDYVTYVVNPRHQSLRFFWKDDSGNIFKSFSRLKVWLEKKNKKLLFAMNGGMYKTDFSPLGLYIENNKIISPLNKSSGYGNFYLKPNGIFYISDDNSAVICRTGDFVNNHKIKYATQSGPMLVINGNIHPDFKKGSSNLNIRNGAGILPDGNILFVLSEKEVSLYDFAAYFKSKGCKNALYLDGFVSKIYISSGHRIQPAGDLGVLIAETEPVK